MRGIHGRALATLITLAIIGGGVAGQSTTWTGSVSTSWSTSGNWSAGVPNAAFDAIIPSGTPNSPSTAGATATCHDLVVQLGATLTIAVGSPIDVQRNVTVNGSVSGGGLLRLPGSNNCSLVGSGTIGANLEILKAPGTVVGLDGNLAVGGNLTQTSGTFQVAGIFTSFTMTVSGNAQFQGGVLNQFHAGVLDVAGNVTFSGTSVTSSLPTIQCGGNWSSNAAFAPTSGQLILDGNGAQSVTSAGVLPGVTIGPTSSVTTSASLVMNGSLTVNGSFTHQGGTLTVNGAMAVNGTAGFTTGTLDLNGSLTVAAGGSIALGGGTHTLEGLTVSGGLTASGTLVFDGATQGSLVSTAPLPSIQVSKATGTVLGLDGNVTVSGNLTQTSGTFQVAGIFASFTLTVGGNAQFQGGVLNQFHAGVIDVGGNVTFSGTSVTSSIPTIRCGGNWSSNAAFAPTSGHLILDGNGAQSVTSAGVLPGATIESTSSVTTSASLVMNGSLTVNGSFTHQGGTLTVNGAMAVNGTAGFTTGTLDLNGSLTVAAGGSIALGGGTHTLEGLAVSGGLTASGTLVFDGATQGPLVSTAPLPSIQVSKAPGAVLGLDGNVTVSGNLTQTSGTFQVAGIFASFTLTVGGNAQFQGGVLNQFHAGVIDVAGNVTFSGTTVPSLVPTIRCGGNWISDSAFTPSGGTVELDGTSATTIAHAVAGGTMSFASLVISNGARTPANDFTLASSTLTVAATGTLAIPGSRHLRVHQASGATAVNVNGVLSVAGNGELSLGPQTSVNVGASGTLTIVGSAGQPAKLTGEAGGGYALTVNGALAAKDFLVKEMGPGGMLVDFGATIAAAPNDLRAGTFDFRTGAGPGSVLLDLRRQAPASNFDALTFLNSPAAPGVFNVRTSASGVPIGFTNATGAFAGPIFENDPNNLIAWNLQPGPTVAAFVVLPGAELAEVVWHTTSSVNVTGYQIRRATSASGPFSVFHSTPNTGSSYGVIDAPLPANQQVFYAGYAVMSGGDVLLIGTGSATPYSSATPGNVKKVGPTGTFATIQAAINAATDPNSVVWVTSGTYDSFTIGATAVPSNLRILGDTSGGPVTISTATGPVVITNVPASSGVELSNLVIGSAVEPHDGIVITTCACPVVLDEIDVSCDGAHIAISVSSCPATAIQRSNVAGGTGLSVTNGSYVAISRGSLSSLVSTGSTIEVSTLTPGSVNVTPSSSLITRTGLMPEINLPEFISLSFPSALFLLAQPNAPFVIGASPRLGFEAPGSNAFEMPFLLDPLDLAQLPTMFTDGLGQAAVGFEVAPIASLLGFSFTVQVVVGDPVTGTPRLSNVESMVCIP